VGIDATGGVGELAQGAGMWGYNLMISKYAERGVMMDDVKFEKDGEWYPVINDVSIDCCECDSSNLEIEVVRKTDFQHCHFCVCQDCGARFIHKVVITKRGDVEVDIYTVPF
jgi:hypothetical protein